MAEWVIALVSALSGAVIGGGIVALWTQRLADKSERRRMRRDVLRRLAGHRYLLTSNFKGSDGEIWVVLNEIVVAYADDKTVMGALDAFRKAVQQGFQAHDLDPLIRAMAEAADLPAESLDADRIESPFTPPKPA